jgi:hypothetical protein
MQTQQRHSDSSRGSAPRTNVMLPVAACILLILASCANPRVCPDIVIGPVYEPVNVYLPAAPFPSVVRRVALLPLACDLAQSDGLKGELEASLHLELGKTGKFDLVRIQPELLRELTGNSVWQPKERLSPALILGLRERLGCDGVLMPELSHLSSYPPLVIGWHVRLLDLATLEILWAVDEVFQASEPAVANAARKHQIRHSRHCRSLTDSRFVLISPALFGRYTTEAIVTTLPAATKN